MLEKYTKVHYPVKPSLFSVSVKSELPACAGRYSPCRITSTRVVGDIPPTVLAGVGREWGQEVRFELLNDG